MDKIKVLFVCVHNSARSQMAEAMLNEFYGDVFSAESAGLEPGVLNPLAVDAMREMDIDISSNKTKSVFDFYKEGRLYRYVITVCDEADGERCPIFPGAFKTLHWYFDDPSKFEGSYEECLSRTRGVRDEIRKKIDKWVKELKEEK